MSSRARNLLLELGEVLLLVLFLIALSARTFLAQSLWLDEGVSFWVAQDSLVEVWHRAITFQGQSPLYYLTLWFQLHLVGDSEWLVRMPSLIALLITCIIVSRLARELFTREAVLPCVVAFVSLSCVQKTLSARPYAMALLFSALSLLCLVRWLRAHRPAHLLGYVLSTLCLFYSHYLFALIGLLHLAVLVRCAEHPAQALRRIVPAILLVGVGMLPGLVQLYSLHVRRDALFYVESLQFQELLTALAPPALLLALVVALVLSWAFAKQMRVRLPDDWRALSALCFGYLCGPICFMAYSLVGSGSLFNDRYFVWYAIPLALLVGRLITLVVPERAQRVCVVAFVLVLAFAESQRSWQIEDWREAARIVNAAGPGAAVLVAPGLVEANDVSWYQDGERSAYLRAPFSYYRLAQLPSLVPNRLRSSASVAYLERFDEATFAQATRVLFVYLRPIEKGVLERIQLMAQRHQMRRSVLLKGMVSVESYERAD